MPAITVKIGTRERLEPGILKGTPLGALSTEALVRDLKRLMQANIEEEIERFVAALNADAIQPMDF